VRATKRTLAVAVDAGFAATLEVEALAQAITQEGGDATEGWEAFQQKRAPNFGD
jgi:enoyl-CoA hydratase/carnithine racemase